MSYHNMTFNHDVQNGWICGVRGARSTPTTYTGGFYTCEYLNFWPMIKHDQWLEFPDLTHLNQLSFGTFDPSADKMYESKIFQSLRASNRYYCMIMAIIDPWNTYFENQIPSEYGPFTGDAYYKPYIDRPMRETRVGFGFYSIFELRR